MDRGALGYLIKNRLLLHLNSRRTLLSKRLEQATLMLAHLEKRPEGHGFDSC